MMCRPVSNRKMTPTNLSFKISAYRNPYSWQDSHGKQFHRTYQILDPNSCYKFRGRLICRPIEWPQRKEPIRKMSKAEKYAKQAWLQNFES